MCGCESLGVLHALSIQKTLLGSIGEQSALGRQCGGVLRLGSRATGMRELLIVINPLVVPSRAPSIYLSLDYGSRILRSARV